MLQWDCFCFKGLFNIQVLVFCNIYRQKYALNCHWSSYFISESIYYLCDEQERPHIHIWNYVFLLIPVRSCLFKFTFEWRIYQQTSRTTWYCTMPLFTFILSPDSIFINHIVQKCITAKGEHPLPGWPPTTPVVSCFSFAIWIEVSWTSSGFGPLDWENSKG